MARIIHKNQPPPFYQLIFRGASFGAAGPCRFRLSTRPTGAIGLEICAGVCRSLPGALTRLSWAAAITGKFAVEWIFRPPGATPFHATGCRSSGVCGGNGAGSSGSPPSFLPNPSRPKELATRRALAARRMPKPGVALARTPFIDPVQEADGAMGKLGHASHVRLNTPHSVKPMVWSHRPLRSSNSTELVGVLVSDVVTRDKVREHPGGASTR